MSNRFFSSSLVIILCLVVYAGCGAKEQDAKIAMRGVEGVLGTNLPAGWSETRAASFAYGNRRVVMIRALSKESDLESFLKQFSPPIEMVRLERTEPDPIEPNRRHIIWWDVGKLSTYGYGSQEKEVASREPTIVRIFTNTNTNAVGDSEYTVYLEVTYSVSP